MLIKQSYRIWWKCDISLVVFSPGSAETNVRWGGKLNGYLMASCIKNISTTNYQNLISYSRKCRGCFFETQCSYRLSTSIHNTVRTAYISNE